MIKRVRTHISKIWAAVALLSVEIIIVTVLFVAAMLGFAYLVDRVFILDNYDIDQRMFGFMSQFVNETNNNIMLTITYLGTHYFLIPANLILIVYFLFIKPHKWHSIRIPAIAISSLLLMFLLKNIFGRARPLPPLLHEAQGMSFPSGHALMSVTFYGLVIYMIWLTKENRLLKIAMSVVLLGLILFIGLSRIYLRVHYTSDVIAGFCMGFLWLVISIWVAKRIEVYSKKKVDVVETT